MARITVEDCVEKLPNRFELVMLAAQRARKIGSGAPLTIERANDKNPVISLREIAGETVTIELLKEELIKSHQRMAAYEEEEESIDLMDGEKEWSDMANQSAAPAQSGIYSDEAQISIDDYVEKSTFSSQLANGEWYLTLTISSSNGEKYTVETVQEFSTAWSADKACQQVAQKFVPAV